MRSTIKEKEKILKIVVDNKDDNEDDDLEVENAKLKLISRTLENKRTKLINLRGTQRFNNNKFMIDMDTHNINNNIIILNHQ